MSKDGQDELTDTSSNSTKAVHLCCDAFVFSEQTARSVMPFRDEAVFQHWLEGLRKAGWEG